MSKIKIFEIFLMIIILKLENKFNSVFYLNKMRKSFDYAKLIFSKKEA